MLRSQGEFASQTGTGNTVIRFGTRLEDTNFSDTYRRRIATQKANKAQTPMNRPKIIKKTRKVVRRPRVAVRPAKPSPKLRQHLRTDIAEVARMRAEAESAVEQARKSHERLRQAIDILPQGVVFLDADGRYVLWNKKYSESTAAARTCSSPARGCRTPFASASSAATIRKPSAAKKSGSPNGSRNSTSPASAMSSYWPTAAAS